MTEAATPNPAPAAAAAAAAAPAPGVSTPSAVAAAAAPAAPAFKPAPDGMTCKICNAPLRYSTESPNSQEYVCSTLKAEAPILADKYEDWRNHFVGSRVTKAK